MADGARPDEGMPEGLRMPRSEGHTSLSCATMVSSCGIRVLIVEYRSHVTARDMCVTMFCGMCVRTSSGQDTPRSLCVVSATAGGCGSEPLVSVSSSI